MNEKSKTKTTIQMPLLALRGLVAFPNVTMHFDVRRPKSILAIKAAMDLNHEVFIVTQSDISAVEPTKKDLYSIGVICTIKQLLKADSETVRVLIEGKQKAKLASIASSEPFYLAEIRPINKASKTTLTDTEYSALVRLVKKQFKEYCYTLTNVPKDIIGAVTAERNPQRLLELIIPNLLIPYEDKQELLQFDSVDAALTSLISILERECNILKVEQELYQSVKEHMDKNQRDYFLREQQRVIAEELGEDEDAMDEIAEFSFRIATIKNMSYETRAKLMRECEKLAKMPYQSQEANVIRSYLEVCLDLPFDESTKDNLDIVKSQKQLDRDHYGLEKVKERILELLSVRTLKPDVTGQIICLVGPPGVGKTSVAASIAKALNRKYVRISLGGVNDESEIRGHRKTYLGAMPGRIIQAFRQAKVNNPLVLFDEIDKMSSDVRGDPASAMLEVLDSEQNIGFVDHYVEIPFDLSRALFITTANTTETIPGPLRDRMEIIELSSYTREEKFNIAKKHLVKKQLNKNGVLKSQLSIKDSALYEIIDCYTREAGVRSLERSVAKICRKAAKLIVSGESTKISVTDENIEKFLSARKYKKTPPDAENQIGTVNGLAWTSVGGELLPIECAIMDGTGKVKLTGSLGDVMKESGEIAVSYVRTIADEYKIKPTFYKDCDIHIHAPEGAVPKDGPSAGVTMVTALVSALTGISVRGDVAMTGEISLRGKVMPIGGLKEKSMAAYREKKTTVIIPYENEPDLKELDKTVTEKIKFVPVKTIKEVLDIALTDIPQRSAAQILSKWCSEPSSDSVDGTLTPLL